MRWPRGQRGQALPLALIFLTVGTLMITPALTYTSTGLHSERISEELVAEQDATDAAVVDAIWRMLSPEILDEVNGSGEVTYPFKLGQGKSSDVSIKIPSYGGSDWQAITVNMFCKIDVEPNWLEAQGERTFYYIFRLDMPSWGMEDFSFLLPKGLTYDFGATAHIGPEKQLSVDPDAEVKTENYNLQYDGSTWTSVSNGAEEHLRGVWGSSSSDVFAVGDWGTILNYDGSTWTPMNSGTWNNLKGIWGSSPSDVFAAGNSGTILHYDGSTWTPMNSGITEHLRGVWGTGASDVFAAGNSGTILHYDGSTWTPMNSGITEHLRGVWGTGASDVFAAGDSGTILHYDGSTWTSMTSGTTNDLAGVWGSSFDDVYAVGDSATVLHYTNSTWSNIDVSALTTQNLNGVWGTGASDVFAVGDWGTILHYDGDTWSPMTSGSTDHFMGVWGSSSSDVFAVGHSRIQYWRQEKKALGWTDMIVGTFEEVAVMPDPPDPDTWYLVISEGAEGRQMLTWRPVFGAFTGLRTYIMVFQATGTLGWGLHSIIPVFEDDGGTPTVLGATATIASAMYNIIIESEGQTIQAVIGFTSDGEVKLISYQVLS